SASRRSRASAGASPCLTTATHSRARPTVRVDRTGPPRTSTRTPGRMLSYNVAALLRAAPCTSRTYPVAVAEMPIADDVELAAPIEGELRLARTSRSILARGHLRTAFVEPCSRCLVATSAPVEVDIEEEALPSHDIDTGLPLAADSEPEALRLDDHHE